MSIGTPAELDLFAPTVAGHASGLLRDFNRAGVISAADVQVARRLAAMTEERDEAVLLAVALAVRGPRLGHVHVDLSRIRETAAVDAEEPVDVAALAWPDPGDWTAAVASSALVAREGEATVSPLRLVGDWLYLDRYWAEEVQVALALEQMAGRAPQDVDLTLLGEGLERLFAGQRDGGQSLAAAAAVVRRFAVVAGGPGTGKTTTVARIAALLGEQGLARGSGLPLIALAAPTGKAAARLQAAVSTEAAGLETPPAVREQLAALQATTLHRLLGWRPGSSSRFRHHRNRRLPHDVVIVDETSMVSLSLMARLIEALRSEARLVLIGDPGQLASIEAGAVLGDIVGPAAQAPQFSTAGAAELEAVTGAPVAAAADPAAAHPADAHSAVADQRHPRPTSRLGDGIVLLQRGHRFGAAIGELAEAIRAGDEAGVIALLRRESPGVRWIEADVAQDSEPPVVREAMVASGGEMITAARDNRAADALAALGRFRILCAHRRGPYGVASWTARAEGWLEAAQPGAITGERWYAGRPLLVTENDYELGLNNGDTGVIVQGRERALAAFERGGEVATYSPTRLGAVDTVYAMTIHKSQGSQFDAAAVLLPEPGSRLLTRELLYTAVTRPRHELILVGTEEAVRAAVNRPVARASGLRWRLWEEGA